MVEIVKPRPLIRIDDTNDQPELNSHYLIWVCNI